LSLADSGEIMVDFGSINSEPVEIIFDSGCFKSVIPLSYVEKLKLDITPYKNCGFVANQEKIIISGATIRTPFDYKHTSTNMSFLILPRNNILLGMDWLTFNKAIINFNDRSITFGENSNKTYYIGESLESEFGNNLSVVLGMNSLEIFKLDLDNTIQDSSAKDRQVSFNKQNIHEITLNAQTETHDLNVNVVNLPISETSYSFKANCASRDNSLAILDSVVKEIDSNSVVPMKLKVGPSPCEVEFKDMMKRQLSLLDSSAKALDPWEDNNLLKFIQTGRHTNGISKRQVGRIELLARRYIFSDNILLYKYQQVPGDDSTFRIVPPMGKREEIVKQAHDLGHFTAEKTMSHVRESFYWPHMYKDGELVLRNCINCLKYKKFGAKDPPALGLGRLEVIPNSVERIDEATITNYDISRIISVRGLEPNIEFLVEWKDKPKNKKTWVLERYLNKCPDQTNTESIISAFKATIKLRMGTRQTSGLSWLNLMIMGLLFLPLALANKLPGDFTFCSVNNKSPILTYDTVCHTGVINPIYKSFNKNKKLNQEEVELSVISPLIREEPLLSTILIEPETTLHLETFLPIKIESHLHSEILCPELRRRSSEVYKNLGAYQKVIHQSGLEREGIFHSQAFKYSLINEK
jgi:hypothetical protein